MINHCRALKIEPDATPQPYWINTSGNCIVKRFIEKANQKEIRLELTYNELDSTIENLWSVLFATGYLTQQGKPQGRTYSLIIPNESIRQIFIEQIRMVQRNHKKRRKLLKRFLQSMRKGTKTDQRKTLRSEIRRRRIRNNIKLWNRLL